MKTAPQQKPDLAMQRPLGERLLWFVALWAGGVATVTIVSFILRFWIAPT